MEVTLRRCGVGKACRGNVSWVLRDKQELGVYKGEPACSKAQQLGHGKGVSAKLQRLRGQSG